MVIQKVLRIFYDLYVSLFIYFSRIGAGYWPKNIHDEENNGAFGVSIIISMWLIIAILFWDNNNIHNHLFQKYTILILCLFIYFINWLILIVFKVGFKFKNKFRSFSKNKKRVMNISSALILLSSILVFIWSVNCYKNIHESQKVRHPLGFLQRF